MGMVAGRSSAGLTAGRPAMGMVAGRACAVGFALLAPVLRCEAADTLTDAMAARRECDLARLDLLGHLVPPVRGVGAARDDSLGCGSRCDDRDD